MTNPMIVAHGHADRAMFRAMPLQGVDVRVIYLDGKSTSSRCTRTIPAPMWRCAAFRHRRKPMSSDIALHAGVTAVHLPYMNEMLSDRAAGFRRRRSRHRSRFPRKRRVRVDARRRARRRTNQSRTQRDGAPFPTVDSRGRRRLRRGIRAGPAQRHQRVLGLGREHALHAPPYKTFAGIALPVIPKIEGHVVDFLVAGGGSGKSWRSRGTFDGGRMSFADVPFDAIHAVFGGTMNDAAINRFVRAVRGAVLGRRRLFDRPRSWRAAATGGRSRACSRTRQGDPGHGPIAGTAAIEVVGNRISFKATIWIMRGATLRGVPVSQREPDAGDRRRYARRFTAPTRAQPTATSSPRATTRLRDASAGPRRPRLAWLPTASMRRNCTASACRSTRAPQGQRQLGGGRAAAVF